jgi:hypothetical protein
VSERAPFMIPSIGSFGLSEQRHNTRSALTRLAQFGCVRYSGATTRCHNHCFAHSMA